MQLIEGTALSDLCDYSFGDHMGAAFIPPVVDGFMKYANESNTEFLNKCKEFETMTLFIDNIRLYNRPVLANAGNDADWVTHLLQTNDLLALCATLPNKFIIFTGQEDTPLDDKIKVPDNVLGVHAVNAIYNNDKVHPFPFGVQRKMTDKDNRIEILTELAEKEEHQEPTKLLYINLWSLISVKKSLYLSCGKYLESLSNLHVVQSCCSNCGKYSLSGFLSIPQFM